MAISIPRNTSERMTLSEKEKRRNWSAEEDLVLLRHVAADRPFAAEDGVMKAWQNLADTLSKCDQFTRCVDGRRVQNRFTALVEKHRRGDIESAKQSGVSEEEDERRMLLDDIIPLLNDLKAEADSKLTKEKEEKLKIDEGASLIREKAWKLCAREKRHVVEMVTMVKEMVQQVVVQALQWLLKLMELEKLTSRKKN
ncbi:unnamed protein product [Aphanomyces euteiches]